MSVPERSWEVGVAHPIASKDSVAVASPQHFEISLHLMYNNTVGGKSGTSRHQGSLKGMFFKNSFKTYSISKNVIPPGFLCVSSFEQVLALAASLRRLLLIHCSGPLLFEEGAPQTMIYTNQGESRQT